MRYERKIINCRASQGTGAPGRGYSRTRRTFGSCGKEPASIASGERKRGTRPKRQYRVSTTRDYRSQVAGCSQHGHLHRSITLLEGPSPQCAGMDVAPGDSVPSPAGAAAGIPAGSSVAFTRPGLPRGANRAAPLRPGWPAGANGSRRGEALRSHHARLNGVPHEFGDVVRAELPHDSAAMEVHGLHRDF